MAIGRTQADSFSSSQILISDWYGTSRELASALIRSSMRRGSRSEMLRVVGLRFGNTTRWARDQST